MAYNGELLSNIGHAGSRSGGSLWKLSTNDDFATVAGADYISDARIQGMKLGDIVFVVSGTLSPVDPLPTGQGVNAAMEFTAITGGQAMLVTAVADPSGAATLSAFS